MRHFDTQSIFNLGPLAKGLDYRIKTDCRAVQRFNLSLRQLQPKSMEIA